MQPVSTSLAANHFVVSTQVTQTEIFVDTFIYHVAQAWREIYDSHCRDRGSRKSAKTEAGYILKEWSFFSIQEILRLAQRTGKNIEVADTLSRVSSMDTVEKAL